MIYAQGGWLQDRVDIDMSVLVVLLGTKVAIVLRNSVDRWCHRNEPRPPSPEMILVCTYRALHLKTDENLCKGRLCPLKSRRRTNVCVPVP